MCVKYLSISLSFVSIIIGWKIDELGLQLANTGHGACWGKRGFEELGEGRRCVGMSVFILLFMMDDIYGSV